MDGQTVVVTGASDGIGAAVARAVADAGGHVVIAASDADPLAETAEAIRAAGGTVTALRADVRDEFDVERLMETAARDGGAIDVVVATASVSHGPAGETPISSDSYAAFDDHLRTNGRGVFSTIREALPHLAADARVLVPVEDVARDPEPGWGTYAVSKATAEAIARGFATELDQVVGVVDPGPVTTDHADADGPAPADVADLFVWAVTEAPADDLDGSIVDADDVEPRRR
jgi:NAD(P)-dependent dehydrogenase (short-subunit alcohol dehydrogenase family)